MKTFPAGSNDVATLTNRERRILAIRDDYARESKRGVRSAFIITDLAYRYYMTESTISAIVWKRGRYGAPTRSAQAVAA